MTLRIRSDQPRCSVWFEPWGSEYVLSDKDEVLVHLTERSDRIEDADIEINHQPDSITVWLPDRFQAWNASGEKLRV